MSDVKLTVGVNEELSFRDFDSSIKKIINKVNNQKYKIKIDLSDESLKDFRNQINEIAKSIKNIGSSANAANGFGNIKSTLKDVSNDYDKVIAKAEKAKASFSSKKFKGYSQISAKQSEYEAAHFKAMENLSNGVASQTEIANVAKLRNELNKLVESYLAVNKASGKSKSSSGSMTENQKTSALTSIDAEIARLESKKVKYSAAKYGESSKYYAVYDKEIENLKALRTQVEGSTKSQNSFNKALRDSKNASKKASDNIARLGKNHESLGDRFKGFAKHFSNWVSTSRAYRFIEQTARKMLTSVIEIDAAMTELKKVTDETEETYNAFLDRAADRAKKLGATLKDTISASADMARLGFDLDDASALADTALVYKNVGDGISDINEASSSIISTMQAFGVEAENSMQIVDKFNTAGNNFAISSGGVGDALLNSASALAAAGNSLDESIAMITAANTVVQDPQKVGTSMKTISMYLRAAKTDAEAAGESTDGMADSVSKLRAEILQLTGGKVDIQIDENNFKSTYQIMKDLSEVWSSLSDISQANILERIGGKRNANITAALLENFELVDKVIDKTSDSTGSALVENEKYLDSVNGKIAQFKASFEELSTEVLDSDILKIIIDAGNIGLETVNAIVGGLKSIAGSLTDLGIGLEYIIPLLGLKFLGVFDDLKDFANGAFSKVGNFFGKIINLAGTTDHTISGILKGWGKKLGKFFTTGFGKATIAIAAISALVSAYKYLSESAERSRQKLQEISDEYNDNTERIKTLNSELDKTRLKMYELLNSDTLTYVEQTELDKLKESNSELEKEIELLRQRNNILEKESHNEFLKTGKNTFDNGFTAFNGLTLEEWFESTINRLLNYDSGFGDNNFNANNGIDFTDILVERLSWYNTKLKEYQEAKENYYKASLESDREHFQESMEQARENYGEAESYIVSVINTLQTDLNSLSGYEYGTDPILDKEIDRYNKWIEKLKIGLGYDEAKDNSFSRHITQTFDDVTDKFEELGKEGKVTAKIIEDAYDNGDGVLGDFINSLIDVGYISGSTNSDLARVASAFNSLGEEAQDAGDDIEDAFKRWTDAQNEVQSGAQFDKIIDAINHVYSTVSDKTSDIYGKVGNSDYKAAIDLLIPVDVDIDEKNLSEVSKYLKDNIKKYFTFDDDGNYKGLNVNRFLQESVTANIMEFDKNSGLYKLINGVSVEKWANELKVAAPLIKAMIGEINEYGGNIQILELDKDFETLAKNANSALTSIKDKFEDFDIDFDLSGKTSEEKLKHLDGLINKITEKRSIAGLDTTSYNNLTKMLEYCVKQKQLLEQPSVVYVDTTQLTDESVIASIEKLQKFVNAYHEVELLATLGYDTKSAEEKLNEIIIELGKDSYLKTQIQIDQNSADSVGKQIYSNLDEIIKNFELPEEIFQPALDATSTLANNINEIFNGKRDLVFNIVSQGDGSFKVSVDSTELDDVENDVEETKNKIKKPFLIDMLVSKGVNNSVSLIERLYNFLSNLTSKKHKVDIDVNTNNNGSVYHEGGGKSGGKSFASGNVDRDKIKSLVGEIDEELVVDPENNTWYTVGKSGAEFVDIPKNAIVFNHKQTKSLLKNGHITGRGRAYGGGNAKDVIKDDTGLIDLGSLIKSGSFENKTNNPNNTQTIKIDINQAVGTASAVNPSQSVGSQSSKGSNNSKKNDSKDVIDWVETTLSRLTRSLENFAKTADDTSKSFSTRSKAIDKEISATNSLITANKKAADTYLKAANNVKLSSELKAKVRSGDYSIKEYDSDTAKQINQYKEYYEKYLEAKDEVESQRSSKSALVMEKFDLTHQKYDSKYGLQDTKLSYYDELNKQAELDGKSGSVTAHKKMEDVYERRLSLLKDEQKELNKLANSSAIKKGTEDWYKMQDAIMENKSEIIATENEIKELSNSITEIQYDRFNEIQDSYENRVGVKDNRISYHEAMNEKAELEGKGGSISAQKTIIKLHKDRVAIMEEEREKLREQLELIPKGTDEWYEAKYAIQNLNTELVNTNNEILKAEENIENIEWERFQNISEEYQKKHSKTDHGLAYYEDFNTKNELIGKHGSIYAQEKMIEWNAKYIENLKNEEAEMREALNDFDKSSQQYQDGLEEIRAVQDKIRDVENQQLQYEKNITDIYFARFQDIESNYENKISSLEHERSSIQHEIDMLEAKGHKASAEYYQNIKSIEEGRLSTQKQQLIDMKQYFAEAMATGKIEEYSQEWYNWQQMIDGCEESINSTELAIANMDKTIRDLEWEEFDYLRDSVARLNNEADFYIELMSGKDMYDDKGNLTNEGMTTIGLYSQKYNTHMEQAAAYSAEIARIEGELSADPSNKELIDRKNELTDAMRENILAANDQKEAMIDLVEEGIQYELDSLQELIDKYKESLEKAKDLNDYNKKVADHASEISSIRKQISAYQGDDSEEAKSKIQKLQQDLKDAEEELNETEYDKFISDQEDLLDDFYYEYETLLNSRLDDVDALIETLTSTINTNSNVINSTLSGLSSEFGIKMSESLKDIWNGGTAVDVLKSFFGDDKSGVYGGQSVISSVLNKIQNVVEAIYNKSDNSYDNNSSGSYNNTFNSEETDISSHNYKIGDELLLNGAVGYRRPGDTDVAFKSIKSEYTNYKGETDNTKYYVVDTYDDYLGLSSNPNATKAVYWVKASDPNIYRYESGGLVDYTGLAWVDGTKSNPEYMLNADDTANLMKLTEDLRKIYSNRQNKNLAHEITGMIGSEYLISDISSDINKAISKSGNSIGDINITIPIEKVQDYNDFITQLRDDPKFDKLVKSLSLDLLDGKSRLAKNKINWK